MDNRSGIEEIVTNAMGNSVTPSRLQNSKKPGIIRRLLGNDAVAGPFLEDIDPDEQPHYLFHTTNRVELPEDEAEDGALLALFGRSSFSPATLLVTDARLLLIYNSGLDRVSRPFEYQSVDAVEHQQLPRIERSLDLTIGEDVFSFEMWDTEEYADELSDAAAYISEKSEVEYTESAYDFQEGQFDNAVETLRKQLHQVGNTAHEVDIQFVLRCAKDGATVGKNPRTIGLGFLLGAGYGIWVDIYRNESEEAPTFDAEKINPQATAKEMIRWKRIGDRFSTTKGGLAGAAIGAAIAIDQQVNDRPSTRILTELDLDVIGQQLESGQLKDGGIEIASQALDSYSEGLGTLLADDFFDQIW